MLPNGKWGVRDPDKFVHVLEHKDKEFFGHENLMHSQDPMERPYILSSLLFKMEQLPEQGEWNGFAWQRLN